MDTLRRAQMEGELDAGQTLSLADFFESTLRNKDCCESGKTRPALRRIAEGVGTFAMLNHRSCEVGKCLRTSLLS
jgi:hypothetical protein